jgi:hypothetical protein
VTLAVSGTAWPISRCCAANLSVLASGLGRDGLAHDHPAGRRRPAVLAAIDTARPVSRARAWKWAGAHAPDHGASARRPVIVASWLARSRTRNRLPRPPRRASALSCCRSSTAALRGPVNHCRCCCPNAGSNTATDHIGVIKAAPAQLPAHRPGKRAGRKVLIGTDGAGCTHDVLTWMSGQRWSCSVGFPLPHNTSDLLELIPADVWTRANDAQGSDPRRLPRQFMATRSPGRPRLTSSANRENDGDAAVDSLAGGAGVGRDRVSVTESLWDQGDVSADHRALKDVGDCQRSGL